MPSKRKQSSSRSILLTVNNTSSSKEIKKLHIFNQPSITQSGSIKWHNDPNLLYKNSYDSQRKFDRCNIPKPTGGSDKIFDQELYINCNQLPPDFILGSEEGNEDWESGELIVNLISSSNITFHIPYTPC